MRLVLALLAVFLSVPVLAHEYRLGTLHIDHPHARETIGQMRMSAGYLVISNEGETADRLIAVESDQARVIELHTHDMKDGVARMYKVDAIEVPAGGTATLAPGGNHLMIFDVTRALKEGETLPVTLIFENAGSVDVDLNIEKIGAHKH